MNITKEFLASLTPPLPDRLPKGAIETLAKQLNFNKKSVGQMLRGRYGSDENLAALFLAAIELMQENFDSIEQERIEWLASQQGSGYQLGQPV